MKVKQLMDRKQFLEECEYAATLIAELAEEIRRGEWDSFQWDEQFSRPVINRRGVAVATGKMRRKTFNLQLERK